MKKVALSAFVIILFGGYAVYQRLQGTSPADVLPQPAQSRAGLPATSPAPANSSPPDNSGQAAPRTPAPANPRPANTSSQSSSGYRDGQYTGSVADAYYGNIQVKAVISGGRITDVQFLRYPNDRRTSIEINTQAMPYLKQEAIDAQSAQVDGVSGATDSSRAFVESLTSALAKAKP